MSAGARVVVCAYSEVGHAALDELLAMGADVRLVVTHADAPGERIWFPSVAGRARTAGIPVLEPGDANAPEVLARVEAAGPDLFYSFYFRQMLGRRLLALPRLGALNLHGSLLPRYRGRAPVNWALVHGEKETGVTLHYMDEKPDHGDVVGRRRVPIERDDTALTLTRKLAAAGRLLLRELHPRLVAGTAPRRPQDHAHASYFGGRRPADGEIDWAQPAEAIRNLVRAVTEPWPGARSQLGGATLLVWSAETHPGPADAPPGTLRLAEDGTPRVATGEGWLELVRAGAPGGEPEPGARWARARGVRSGDRFGVSGAG